MSEFLSEDSPEYRAVRQASEIRPPAPPAPPVTLPAPPAAPPPAVVATPVEPAPAPVTARPSQVPSFQAPAIKPAAFPRPPQSRETPWGWVAAVVFIASSMIGVAWVVARPDPRPPAAAPQPAAVITGTATIISRPEGAEVFVEGASRGVTPLKLSLPAGSYAVELRNGAARRSLTMTIDPATATREFVDLAPAPAGRGRIEVTTDVAGARVSVNGVGRGVTPLVLTDVEPGTHRLTITSGGTSVNRTVTVQPGATATVVASVVPSGATGGWVSIQAPIEMQVIENGRVIGTTSADRLMLPAGRHELDLVADPFEFRTRVTALVGVGNTATIPVQVPNGQISINAVPWADVWIDGQALGSTPLANVPVSVGTHEIVWRHPQLGERRQTVRVLARTPGRVGIDLTR